MKFEDIHEYMWIKYNDDYWCVVHMEDDVCYLENDVNDTSLTRSAFNQHHIEQVQPTRFYLYEKVIYVGRVNKELHNKIVTVTNIEDVDFDTLPYLVESNEGSEWSTPFELQKINY